MRVAATTLALVLAIAGTDVAGAADQRQLPYYGSIGAGSARMRTGPARTYPASWLYRRADLPIRVVDRFREKAGGDWYKIEDPDGTQGWMQATLLRDTRTAIVRGDQPLPMRDAPSGGGKLLYRAAPGVVGRIGQCRAGWCRFDVKGQAGFVEVSGLWGVDPEEVLP